MWIGADAMQFLRVACMASVVGVLTGCACLDSDPRAQWGHFENSRSIGSPELPIKSKPWGQL